MKDVTKRLNDALENLYIVIANLKTDEKVDDLHDIACALETIENEIKERLGFVNLLKCSKR